MMVSFGRAVLTLLSAFVAENALQTDESLKERVAVRLRTVRVRIEPTQAAEPGECRRLGLADLKVKLRGDRLRQADLIELDRERKPNLHLLLLDMSGSMLGREERVRRAASKYIDRLNPDDQALIVTFDESVILAQAATGDSTELRESINRIRLSGMTSINDGLYFAIRELDSHDMRPVIVLMTDGQDTASIHRRSEILELIDARPELVIFTVGIPPPSMSEPKSLFALEELSGRSNGKMFFAPSWHLENVFLQIHDLLDNEALLTINDPPQGVQGGRIKVRATTPACKISVFDTRVPARIVRMRPPFTESPARIPFPPASLFSDLHMEGITVWVDPRCGEGEISLDDLWFLQVSGNDIRGCGVDVLVERGLLYDHLKGVNRQNEKMFFKTRWFEIDAPLFDDLPIRAEEVMDRLARFAISLADSVPDDFDKQPLDDRVQLYDRYPFLMNGQMFFDGRTQLGKALFVLEDYRRWLLEQLERRAKDELNTLKTRLHKIRPELDAEKLDSIARSSEPGKSILAMAEGPSDADLRGRLAGWIEDIAAHDLFVRWEQRHIDRLIARPPGETQVFPFMDGWRELGRVFRLPTHARVLTLLTPFFDPDHERVGFRRVVLPRPSWMSLRRMQQAVPLDLVPDLPFAYWHMDRLFRDAPDLAAHLRDRDYRVVKLKYEILKPRKGDFNRRTEDVLNSFRNTRVTVVLGGAGTGDSTPVLEIVASLSLGRKRIEPTVDDVRISVRGDPELQALVAETSHSHR